MYRPSPARRVLKWTGIGASVLIPVAWIASVFAGLRIVTPVGSISLHRGVVGILRTPPMAEFEAAYAAANSMMKDSKEWLRKAEAEITVDEARDAVRPILEDAARTMIRSAEDGQAVHAATWGIPIATTADQTMGIVWLKPYGPRLSRPGLGLCVPTTSGRASRSWPGVWIPLWVFMLTAAATWGVIRWRRRTISLGHCTKCGYDLTGNTSGVCSECGTKIDSGQRASISTPLITAAQPKDGSTAHADTT